jgi:hypothetical protein
MSEDVIERAFMEIDFKNRTVFNIITSNGFASLMFDSKVNDLLEEIWVGNSSYECDGTLSDFSLLTFLLSHPFKPAPGRTVFPHDLLTSNFKLNTTDNKFWF